MSDPRTTTDQISPHKLRVPGPLFERAVGHRSAPVTVIGYLALTCPHSAAFYAEVASALRERAARGEIYFIVRDFPTDALCTAAALIAHAAGSDRYFDTIATLFKKQPEWADAETPIEALKSVAARLCIDADAALQRRKIFSHVKKVSQRAAGKFHVALTPTIFVNGQKIEGAASWSELETIIESARADAGPAERKSANG